MIQYLTPTLQSLVGAFWLYATFSAVGISVLAYILPETKGKSLEQVQELFTKPYC